MELWKAETDRSTTPGAAVSILETHAGGPGYGVRGLARMVQVAPKLTIIDLTVHGLSPGTYFATVRENGDISAGAASTGGVWRTGSDQDDIPRGQFGKIEVGKSGVGSVLLDKPVEVWEMIGRSFVVSKQQRDQDGKLKDDQDTLVGVIARSAGVWENLKTV